MEHAHRKCSACKASFPLTAEFFFRRLNGFQYECKVCSSEACKKRVQAIPPEERRRRRAERLGEDGLAKARESLRQRNRKWKADAISAYGGKCTCCGEHHIEFLAIDHVNEDGHVHRANGLRSGHIYHWLKKNGYPQDGRFQVLCHNCNMSKSMYGGCPHNGPVPYMSLQVRLKAQIGSW